MMSLIDLALLGQVMVWLIVAGMFIACGQASLFHPLTFYLGFHGLVFVLRPLLVHYLDFDTLWRYMLINPSEEDFIRTLVVTSVALLAFSIPCILVGWSKTSFAGSQMEPFSVAQRRGLILVTLMLGPVIAYSIHSSLGGGMQGKSIGGVFILTGASGYTLEAQYMFGPLICAWLAVTRFNRFVLLPLGLYIAYRSYMGWNRWSMVLLFLSLCAVYAWQNRLKWVPRWAVLLAIPLLMLFQTLGKNRDYFRMMLAGESVEQLDQTGAMTGSETIKLKYDTQEFANFDYVCYILKAVPELTKSFTYGTQYLQLFTEPIPRKLWPGKPVGAPIGFFNLNNYGNFNGLTPSLPGDGWMSGGWIASAMGALSMPGVLPWAPAGTTNVFVCGCARSAQSAPRRKAEAAWRAGRRSPSPCSLWRRVPSSYAVL